MARILRRPEAVRDLLSIWRYVAESAGDERAGSVIRTIDQKLHTLAEFPQMGRRRDELAVGLRSIPVAAYLVFYYPLDDGIELVRVLDSRRDIPALFGEG
jgi:toxin ParE1/3/4